MIKKKITKEKLKSHGKWLYEKANELAREGSVRHVFIKDKHQKTVIQFPMLLGLAGVLIAPVLASIGLIAFFLTEASLVVERKVDSHK